MADPVSVTGSLVALIGLSSKLYALSQSLQEQSSQFQGFRCDLQTFRGELELLQSSLSVIPENERYLMEKDISNLDPEKTQNIAKDLRVLVARYRAALCESGGAGADLGNRALQYGIDNYWLLRARGQRLILAERQFPDDEPVAGCFPGTTSNVLIYDPKLLLFGVKSWKDVEDGDNGAFIVRLSPWNMSDIYVFLESRHPKNGFSSARARAATQRRAPEGYSLITEVPLSSLSFSRKVKILKRDIRWLVVWRPYDVSRSSTDSSKKSKATNTSSELSMSAVRPVSNI